MRFSLRYLYKRLRFLGNKLISHFITLAFVALWHGIAPGFFLCFIGEFVIIVMEQQVAIKMMKIYRYFHILIRIFFKILSQKFVFSRKRLRDIRNWFINWMSVKSWVVSISERSGAITCGRCYISKWSHNTRMWELLFKSQNNN